MKTTLDDERLDKIRRDRFECPSLLDRVANRLMHADIPWLLEIISELRTENEELKEEILFLTKDD